MSITGGTTAAVTDVRLRKRRIVERPRLYKLLDDSKAPVRMLIASAGYGKSTLAEQWVARDGRIAAWYTARSSARDVAALALGLARSATAVVDGCDERLREHLRAVPGSADTVVTMAEILGEDLAEWPPNAWLVIDDYQEVAREPKAEQFVAALIGEAPIQVLIASRQRPSWVTSKDILYGEVLEVSQTSLAMDTTEAADVLIERGASSASGLVALANGWPAVIGLASVSSAEIEPDDERVPESLYRYFADEIFDSLGGEVRQGLMTLSVAPVLDWPLTRALLEDRADEVAARCLDVGILVERDNRLDLHPLARAFLGERSAALGLVAADGAAQKCLAHYRRTGEWDAAFEIVVRHVWPEELEPLLTEALDALLESARLSTIESWCNFAFDAEIDGPLFNVACAEVLLRQGCHLEAIAHAEAAAERHSQHSFRALTVSGRAAHLASQEERSLDLFERAVDVAANESERSEAQWGQVVALIDLEEAESASLLTKLKRGLRISDARAVVRAADRTLQYQIKMGNLDLTDADAAARAIPRVRDPMVLSSFQSGYSCALGIAARYDEAAAVANTFVDTVQTYRLSFARPYAYACRARALSGLRKWDEADESIRTATTAATEQRDEHAQQLCCALWLRILAQRGLHLEAAMLELPIVEAPLPSMHAELTASRALLLAQASRLDDARALLNEVRDTTAAIEASVLIDAVDAIVALTAHDPDAIDFVLRLEDAAFQRGAPDLLVTAYRASPLLLSVLLRAVSNRTRLNGLLRRVGDTDLAKLVGQPISAGDSPYIPLSRREHEVYDLIVQGLTNREIAKLLYIEESTVKAHAHRIYDKVGVRSRVALRVHAALARPSQATSAIARAPDDTSS